MPLSKHNSGKSSYKQWLMLICHIAAVTEEFLTNSGLCFDQNNEKKTLQKQITIWELEHIVFYFFRMLDMIR